MTRERQFQARLRAWSALPGHDRAIFTGVRIEGLNYDEVARRHGCTARDVEQVIVRVLVALMEADDDAPP